MDLGQVQVQDFFPDNELTRGDLADYAVEVEYHDKTIGLALKALEDRNLLENTLVIELCNDARLVLVHDPVIGEDGEGGDEDVLSDGILQDLGGAPDPGRLHGRIVDHDVPLPALQRLEVVVPVPDKLLHFGEKLRIRRTPVEQRDGVTALQSVADLVRTDESGTAQDQNPQGIRG